MAQDIRARFQRLRWLVTKLETNHAQIDEMMLLQVQDGLSAQAFGGFGGNVSDPTARTVVAPDTAKAIWARDNRAETDRGRYWALIASVEKQLEEADKLRQTYMSANNDIRNRLDPTDWCVLHFALHLYEGHRRVKGNLCKICAAFYDENGREPTNTDIDYWHRKGAWPHKLVDPKQRRAV